jgi:hypothetical protein
MTGRPLTGSGIRPSSLASAQRPDFLADGDGVFLVVVA